MQTGLKDGWPGHRAGIGPESRQETHEADTFLFAQALVGSRQKVSPHGLLTPWRFVLIPPGQRHRLSEVFALALIDRDPGATLEQIESAREKAHRAPLLLGAHAMGHGAGQTSGQAMSS